MCRRQESFGLNGYLCNKCLKKVHKPGKNELFSSDEWKSACSERSKVAYKNLSDESVNNIKAAAKDPDRNKKLSESIKAKFKDPIYVSKIIAARKSYWLNQEYRDKQSKIRLQEKISGVGIFGPKPRISSLQVKLYEILKDIGVDFTSEYKIGFYHFDCYLPEYKILVECHGDYFHNLPEHIRNDSSKATYISKYFPEMCLKVLWEHEFLNPIKIRQMIMNWIGKNFSPIYVNLSDCKILEIENKPAVQFISKYHYAYSLGHGRSQIRYGLFYNDELIAVACFASVTRDETAVRLGLESRQVKELVRLCRHPGFENKNMLSWFLSRVIKQHDWGHVKYLISFADRTVGHTGSVYKACNWKYDGESQKSYWYRDQEGYIIHKKTVYNHARKMSMKEMDFAKKHNLQRVWGKSKARYILGLN